jgi:hypothetical protein
METVTNPTHIPAFPKPYAKWKPMLLALEVNQYIRVSGEWKENTLRQACLRSSINGRRYRLHKENGEVQIWRMQ